MEIVLVRHGETQYNVASREGRLFSSPEEIVKAGCLPDHRVPLTQAGRMQARRAGPVVASHGSYDVAFHSPYLRAEETLDLIIEALPEETRNGLHRRPHLALRERDPGYVLNMDVEEARTHFPWYFEYEARTGPFYARPPGGESIADVYHRVHGFYVSLRRARPGQRALVVAHSRVILCLRAILEKWTVGQMEDALEQGGANIGNCEVLPFAYDRAQRRYVERATGSGEARSPRA